MDNNYNLVYFNPSSPDGFFALLPSSFDSETAESKTLDEACNTAKSLSETNKKTAYGVKKKDEAGVTCIYFQGEKFEKGQ